MITYDEKRALLKKMMKEPGVIEVPGAFNAICAKLVETHGFKSIYISGSATSGGSFALPDIGLVTLADTTKQVQRISRVVELPAICDGDTGFGGIEQIPYTVHAFECHGAAAVHFEDQIFPKRCGHVEGKKLVSVKEFSGKIKRAVDSRQDPNLMIIARSDAHSVTGMDDLIDRLKHYRDAGADVVFPEALTSLAEYERVVKEVGIPVMANMTEFGQTPFIKKEEFENVGCKIVLYPVSLMRYALGALRKALESIKENGNQEKLVDDMMTRQEIYDLIDYNPMEKYERKY